MTLVVSIPTQDGIVLASDSQVTSGAVRAPGEKLFKLNQHCAWSGAGELSLIQRVSENIGGGTVNQTLHQLRDQLARVIRSCMEELLQLDFRTQFFTGDHNQLLQLHPGNFIFAECRGEPVTLHVSANGTPEWIENRAYAIGNGAPFAYALLRKFHTVDLDLETGSVLAVKVIEEAIDVGAYGLGRPIQLMRIMPDGISRAQEAELAMLSDAAKGMREQEIELLVSHSEAEEKSEEEASAGPATEVEETGGPGGPAAGETAAEPAAEGQ